MKDIVYWNAKVQQEIDGYPEGVLERINFELVALQTNCPTAFDDFDFDEDEPSPEEEEEEGAEAEEAKTEFPPAQKKSMRETIGRHAMQLTIKSVDSYRVIYVVKHEEAVYILHTFKKKTEGVAKKDYTTASSRYKQLDAYRKKKKLK